MKPCWAEFWTACWRSASGALLDPAVRASIARIKHSVTSSEASLLKLWSMGAVLTDSQQAAPDASSSSGYFMASGSSR